MDPTAGSLREPLLKVFHLLRAMEFEPAQYYEQALINRDILEQMVFESPTVFNYYQPGERSDLMIQNMPIAGAFLSVTNLLNGNKCVQSINQSINLIQNEKQDFQPAGLVASAGLVAPEAQILTTPNIIEWINGVNSLIRWGLTDCVSSKTLSTCLPCLFMHVFCYFMA